MIQAIPDRWVDKYSNLFVITNSLCNADNEVTYEVLLEKNKISFYYLSDDDFWMQQELKATFPRSTFREATDYIDRFQNADCVQMELEHSYALALKTDRRETSPIADIISVAKILNQDESALMQLVCRPIDKSWYQECQAIQKQITNEGTEPKFNSHYASILLINVVAFPLVQMEKVAKTFLCSKDSPETTISPRLNIKEFSENTNKKPFSSALEVQLRFAATGVRKDLILRLLQSSLRDLEGDNKFIPTQIGIDYILDRKRKEYLSSKLSYNYDLCILSAYELERFVQLPSYTLQSRLPDAEVVMNMESVIPKEFTEGGILLGTARQGNKQVDVFFPLNNSDLASKMKVSIGGSRSGKSTSAVNESLEALANGISVIYLDPAAQASYELRDSIPKGLIPESHILHFDFRREDYLPAVRWNMPKGDVITATDYRTNAMIWFLDRFSDTKMGDRTKRFFRAASKTTGDFLSLYGMFVNKDFALKQIEKVDDPAIQRLWQMYWKSGTEKESYSEPIISRLDALTGDDLIANCLLQHPRGWDMASWMNGDYILGKRVPYCVLITLPENKESMNVLGTYLMNDILLSALQRSRIPASKRPLCFVQIDEPHQLLCGASGGANSIWGVMASELPKYRVAIHFYLHAFNSEQIPTEVKKIIRGADPHYTLFQTDKDEFKALADEFAPIELEEFMCMPLFDSLNRIICGNSKYNVQVTGQLPPFDVNTNKDWRLKYIDRSDLSLQCAKKYGRAIADIRKDRYQRQRQLLGG